MLFLSRMLSATTYEVVDTDDYVGEKVDFDTLRHLVLDLGLHIEGVTVETDMFGDRDIEFGAFYQDPKFSTGTMARMKAMYGVDIRVYNDEVTWIGLDGNITPPGTRIVISKFAHKFSFNTPIQWSVLTSRPERGYIIIVFDDSVEVVGSFVPFAQVSTVLLDISNYSDEFVAQNVYNGLLAHRLRDFARYIIDKPERMERWSFVAMMYEPLSSDNPLVKALQRRPDYSKISEKIGERFFDTFQRITDKAPHSMFFGRLTEPDEVDAYIKSTFKNGVVPYIDCKDYAILQKEFTGVFSALILQSVMNSAEVRCFANYISYFKVPEHIQKLYIRLCNNVAKYYAERYHLEE